MLKWKEVSGGKIQFYVKLFEEGTYHLGFAEHSKVTQFIDKSLKARFDMFLGDCRCNND